MKAPNRGVISLALCFVLASCSTPVTSTGTTEPLRPPTPVDEPTTTSETPTTSSPGAFVIEWERVDLDFGVTSIISWAGGYAGLAVQDFNAPSSLIEEGDSGCIGFQAGRTGEVVWSPDGLTWEPFATQPAWYTGPLSPERWAEIVLEDEGSQNIASVGLATDGDRLLSLWYDDQSTIDGFDIDSEAVLTVDAWDPDDRSWQRYATFDTSGFEEPNIDFASTPMGPILLTMDDGGDARLWRLSDRDFVPIGEAALGADGATEDPNEHTSVELIAGESAFVVQVHHSGTRTTARSPDGLTWEIIDDPAVRNSHDLAVSGDIVVSAGVDGVVWRSDDAGVTWVRVDGLAGLDLVDVSGHPGGFLAWAFDTSWMAPSVWYSVDGAEWTSVLSLPDDRGWLHGLTADRDELVISAGIPGGGWVCPEAAADSYEMWVGRLGD